MDRTKLALYVNLGAEISALEKARKDLRDEFLMEVNADPSAVDNVEKLTRTLSVYGYKLVVSVRQAERADAKVARRVLSAETYQIIFTSSVSEVLTVKKE